MFITKTDILTTCEQRPIFYSPMGGLYRQVLSVKLAQCDGQAEDGDDYNSSSFTSYRRAKNSDMLMSLV